jgi:GNAT superfamily N-acetyltransferase
VPDAVGLVSAHVRALFECDGAGRLVRVNEPGGGPAPRLFIGVAPEGVCVWFRHDLDGGLVRDLEEVCRAIRPGSGASRESAIERAIEAAVVERLAVAAPIRGVWAGPAFRFPGDVPDEREDAPDDRIVRVTGANASVLEPFFEDWLEDVEAGLPFVAVLESGRAVSICCNVRMTPEAHEAGVETHPDFRGRGHAVAAVTAWAGLVRERGAIPLYSTSWDNDASLAVARKLGVVRFCADLHVT